MGKYEKPPVVEGVKMPYMDAEAVYLLRCLMVHEGNTDIKVDNHIDHFTLVTEATTDFNIYGGNMCAISATNDGIEKRICRINVQDFCRKMCLNAEDYYMKNKEKFEKNTNDIQDWDEVKKKLGPVEINVSRALVKMRGN